jgi:hypothetical protein
MTVQIPASKVRAESLHAAARATSQGLVSQAELDAIFAAPVITPAERTAARAIVNRLQTQLNEPTLASGRQQAAAALVDCLNGELAATPRVEVAHAALRAGAIDQAMYAKVTAREVGLLTRVALFRRVLVEEKALGRSPSSAAAAGTKDTDRAAAMERLAHHRALAESLGSSFDDAVSSLANRAAATTAASVVGASMLTTLAVLCQPDPAGVAGLQALPIFVSGAVTACLASAASLFISEGVARRGT